MSNGSHQRTTEEHLSGPPEEMEVDDDEIAIIEEVWKTPVVAEVVHAFAVKCLNVTSTILSMSHVGVIRHTGEIKKEDGGFKKGDRMCYESMCSEPTMSKTSTQPQKIPKRPGTSTEADGDSNMVAATGQAELLEVQETINTLREAADYLEYLNMPSKNFFKVYFLTVADQIQNDIDDEITTLTLNANLSSSPVDVSKKWRLIKDLDFTLSKAKDICKMYQKEKRKEKRNKKAAKNIKEHNEDYAEKDESADDSEDDEEEDGEDDSDEGEENKEEDEDSDTVTGIIPANGSLPGH